MLVFKNKLFKKFTIHFSYNLYYVKYENAELNFVSLES